VKGCSAFEFEQMEQPASTNQENLIDLESPGRSKSVPSRKRTGTPSSENRSRSSSPTSRKFASGTAI